MLKILHITPSYKPAFVYGGPTVSVSRLCEELSQAGVDISVYTTTANGDKELRVETGQALEVDGVQVIYFSRLTGDHTHFSPALLWRLWQVAKKFDIIHIHSWWNLVAVFSVLICLLRGIRPVLAPRGMLSAYSFSHENSLKKKLIHTLLGRWLLPRTLLHATTALEVRDCQKIVPDWEYFILPNIISLPQKTIQKASPPDKTFRLIFLSRVDPKKGLELLFEALAQVKIPYQLSIYGNREDAYEQKLRELSQELNIVQHIHWGGWVGPEEKYEKLAESDLFVLTSYNENFANVVVESLSVGTPVLLSDQVGLEDYVRASGSGWVTGLAKADIVSKLEEAYSQLMIKKQSPLRPLQVYKDFDGRQLAVQYLEKYHELTTGTTKHHPAHL